MTFTGALSVIMTVPKVGSFSLQYRLLTMTTFFEIAVNLPNYTTYFSNKVEIKWMKLKLKYVCLHTVLL